MFTCTVRKSNKFFAVGSHFLLEHWEFFMAFPCSLLLDCSSFKEVIECSAYLGCSRFSFIPRCRVFFLTACAVVFEGRNQAYELEGQGFISIVSAPSLKSQQLYWLHIFEKEDCLLK